MKIRYPLAGLFLVLELPVLLPFAAGALVAAIFSAIVVLRRRAAHGVRLLLSGSSHRLHVRFDEPGEERLRDHGYRLRVTFNERGRESVILALGLAAAVALGALIAG